MNITELSKKYHISPRTIRQYTLKKEFVAEKTSVGWNIDDKSFDDWYNDSYILGTKQKWNRNYFKTIDTPQKAYWLGFITADGCLNEANYRVSIDIGGKDEEHLYSLIDEIQGSKTLISRSIHSDTKNPLVHLNLCGQTNYNNLLQYGLTERKNGKEKYFHTNFEKDYIRGLIDGDGCILTSLKRIDLVGSYSLLNEVQQMFLNF